MIRVSASIVIYNEEKETLKKAIESFLSIDLAKELIIVDNSSQPYLKFFIESFTAVKYIYMGKNIGFGAGHNLAFKNLTQKSNIHLIINPDTYFDGNEIKLLVNWMYKNTDLALVVPRVYFPDGTVQNTIRNIPTPLTLIKRRLNIGGVFNDFINKDHIKDQQFKEVSDIPFAHGCFFLFRSEIYKKMEGFDERFFMYMEDVDIFIKAKKFGRTVINPKYKVFHEYRKGSSKNLILLIFHIVSALKFFIKYPNWKSLKKIK